MHRVLAIVLLVLLGGTYPAAWACPLSAGGHSAGDAAVAGHMDARDAHAEHASGPGANDRDDPTHHDADGCPMTAICQSTLHARHGARLEVENPLQGPALSLWTGGYLPPLLTSDPPPPRFRA